MKNKCHFVCATVSIRYCIPIPRKIRQLIKDLTKAGFVNRGGKGSHCNFEHALGVHVVISGQEGADAHRYQEKGVKLALAEIAAQTKNHEEKKR